MPDDSPNHAVLSEPAAPKGAEGAGPRRFPTVTPDQVRAMTESGVIAGGMIPKTETALAALEQG